MLKLHLKIITPRKVVLDRQADRVTVPSADGEITILPRHTYLLSLLNEGIVRIKESGKEDLLAIGGGYLETDGKDLNILVSRAYGQDEIDADETEKALAQAKLDLEGAKDEKQKQEAQSLLRRSLVEMKLLKKRRTPKSYP